MEILVGMVGQVKSSRGATRPRGDHPDPNLLLPSSLLQAGSLEFSILELNSTIVLFDLDFFSPSRYQHAAASPPGAFRTAAHARRKAVAGNGFN